MVFIVIAAIVLAGCSDGTPTPSASPPPATPLLPSPIPTLSQPSPTPVPLAATVNEQSIPLSEYQAELSRYQAAVGTELATEDEQRVLNDLIDQLLLAQAAAEAGFVVDETTLQERYAALAAQLGGDQALRDWMEANAYVEESFRQALARSAAAAWMRDQVAAGVPAAVEQVHIRQILLYNSEEADSVIAQLRSGADFAKLAALFDPAAGGELGWVPRGYLLDAALDEAAFSLQPGEFSAVIQSSAGYHILQVLEREPLLPLESDARLALQRRALQDWLASRRSQSQIQVFTP
ncbi:MAG: hypothetical protein A2W36_05095 [Chloroflexi bacterium RBG_16_58_14]|nr:MAG: hypothetical protein A2W36_05095 [Chloroflexi bacterium RBG_16_58_14]